MDIMEEPQETKHFTATGNICTWNDEDNDYKFEYWYLSN